MRNLRTCVSLMSLCLAGALASVSAWAGQAPQGWRGDGTGKYPAADPPLTWGRISQAVKELRFQAAPPGADATGRAMPDGVVREWLVLGPVPLPENTKVSEDTLPDEAQLNPRAGEKTAGLAWKKVAVDTACLDFIPMFGQRQEVVAYACAQIYSETGGKFRMNTTFVGGLRVILNGKPAPAFGARISLTLAKGWNRLLLKASPGATGWYLVPIVTACPPTQYDETSIAWTLPLPDAHPGFYGGGMGVGAPIIVGERLYLLVEPDSLVCVNKADGKVLWSRSNTFFDAATEEEKKHPAYQEAEPIAGELRELSAAAIAGTGTPQKPGKRSQLDKELSAKMKSIDKAKYTRPTIPDIGYAGFTPCTDGQYIYAWFASGVSVCYDLEGHRRWIRVDVRPAVEHGFTSSPLLVDGKFVVFMRDLMAFDAATGKLAWLDPLVSHEGLNPGGFCHGSLVAATIGGTKVIALANGAIVRASDGKVLCRAPDQGGPGVASPVVEADTLYQVSSSSMKLFIRKLPAVLSDSLVLPEQVVKVETTSFPTYYLPWHLSSPVVHEGLAYLVNNSGVLTVVDMAAGRILYQRMLDFDAFQSVNEGAGRGIGISPALAGKRLYFFGNCGAAVVVEPGREFKQVAKNKIESVVLKGHWAERQERFIGNPVFDGPRLYLRGEGNLYAIGPR
jgi:outer membrane protein assembly factor BamB